MQHHLSTFLDGVCIIVGCVFGNTQTDTYGCDHVCVCVFPPCPYAMSQTTALMFYGTAHPALAGVETERYTG